MREKEKDKGEVFGLRNWVNRGDITKLGKLGRGAWI